MACTESVSVDEDFALAYAELRVAEREYGETEDSKAVRFQVLQKHNLDADTFEKKIENIKKEAASWVKFQKTVVDILDSMGNKKNEQP